MDIGMPTLIELESIEDNIKLAVELNLSFIEINMNLPEYQPNRMDLSILEALKNRYNVYFTMHLPEDFDPAVFNDDIREGHLKMLEQALEIARKLNIPVVNFHLSPGIYFTLPDRKLYLYEKYNALYRTRLERFRDIVDSRLKGSKTKMTIENTGLFDQQIWMDAVSLLLSSDTFRLTWDIGHDYSSGGKDELFMKRNENRIVHMHLHDAIGTKNHLPLYTGDINIQDKLTMASMKQLSVVIETKTVEGLTRSIHELRNR